VYRGPGAEPLSVTTTLIIVNVAAACLTILSQTSLSDRLLQAGMMQASAVLRGQVWRLLTATYLHGGLDHLLVNMLGLYFLGPALERIWGRRQFFFVYTLGGVAGNILLTVAGVVGFINPSTYGVGASGSILTLLGAAAVLLPDSMVYVYFVFPLRIRTCVLLYCLWYLYNIFQQGSNYGGDLCHIAGLVVGIAWSVSGGLSLSGLHRTAASENSLWKSARRLFGGGWGHSVDRGHPPRRPAVEPVRPTASTWTNASDSMPPDATIEIDRILEKISREGFASLTLDEKRTLSDAARR